MTDYGHDDLGGLDAYFAEFTTAGDIPVSLGGYGHSPQRYNAALAELGVAPKRTVGFGAVAATDRLPVQPGGGTTSPGFITVRELQQLLTKTGGARVTGKWDTQTELAWKNYVGFVGEPHTKIAPRGDPKKGPGVFGYTDVWISGEALARLRANAKKLDGATPAPKPKPKKPAALPAGAIRVSTSDVQAILLKLGHDPDRISDGKLGPTTKGKWKESAEAKGLNATITGATGSVMATVSEATYNALSTAAGGAAPTPTPADMEVSTHDVQGILKRLGAPPERLSDGKYGTTTDTYWRESASKRTLDPFIASKGPRGAGLETVTVRKDTYFKLKADADAKTPIDEKPVGSSMLSLPPDVVIVVPVADLNALFVELGPTVGIQPKIQPAGSLGYSGPDMIAIYIELVKTHNLDGKTEQVPPDKIALFRTFWNALNKLAEDTAPVKPTPGPAQDEQAAAIAKIKKGSTDKIKVNTIRAAFNASIQAGIMKREPFEATGKWRGTLREPLLNWLGLEPGKQRDYWAAALTTGNLVSGDKKSVKLPPKFTKTLRAQAKLLKEAKKKEKDRFKNFTKANPATLIAKINSIGATTKKFDKSGGAKELADAIATFFEETDTPKPAGDMVRTDKEKTFVRNSVLTTLAQAASAAEQRGAATKAFRSQMVANALSESPATMTVKELQESMKDISLRSALPAEHEQALKAEFPKKALKLFKKVKVSGRFDEATRTAYTHVSRALIIGTGVQEYQKLLQQQMGPSFQAKLVKEVRNQVWNEYLDKALSKSNGELVLKTTPAIAKNAKASSAFYRKNIRSDVRRAEEVTEQNLILNTAVGKSTAIVSVLDVQQALKQMASQKFGDALIKSTGVQITAAGDKATREGLFQLSSHIFPEDYLLPETTWMAYLNKVGITMLAFGGQQPGEKMAPPAAREGWRGAQYVALPPALADLVSKNAGKWIAANGDSDLRASLAPLPHSNQSLRLRFKDYVVVAAKKPVEKEDEPIFTGAKTGVPEPTPEEKPAEVKKAEVVAQKKTDVAVKKTQEATQKQAQAQEAETRAQQQPQDERLRQQANAAHQEAARATGGAQQAAGEARAAQDVSTQAGGAQVTGPAITGPTITGPTIQITTPAPVQKAGMGAGGMIAIAAASVAGLFLLLKGDGEGE